MKRKRPSGPINSSQVLALMRACLENAESIRADADLLFTHEKYTRAAYLYAICLEEVAKLPLLLGCPEFGDDPARWREFWKKFRSHESKLNTRIAEILFDLVNPTSAKIVGWAMRHMDALKQRALYVDLDNQTLSKENAAAWQDLAEALRGTLEVEVPIHRLVAAQITEDLLKRVGSQQPPDPLAGESPSEYLARNAPGLAKWSTSVPPREPSEGARSYARRVYGPIFDILEKARQEEADGKSRS